MADEEAPRTSPPPESAAPPPTSVPSGATPPPPDSPAPDAKPAPGTPRGPALLDRLRGSVSSMLETLRSPESRASIEDRILDSLVALLLRARRASANLSARIPQIIAFLSLPISIVQLYLRSRSTYLAAAIASYVALSIIPYFLLAAAILGYMVEDTVVLRGGGKPVTGLLRRADDESYLLQERGKREPTVIPRSEVLEIQTPVVEHLQKYAEVNFPVVQQDMAPAIRGIAENKEGLTFVGLLLLIWTSRGLVFSVSFALNAIHGNQDEKPLWRGLVDTVLMVCLAALLITASIVFSIVLAWVSRLSGLHLDEGYTLKIITLPFSLVISGLVFLAFYQIVPQTRQRWTHSLIGAAVGAGVFEIAKYLLIAYFALRGESERVVYATMMLPIYITLWSYLFATGVLLGACTSRRLDEERKRATYLAE